MQDDRVVANASRQLKIHKRIYLAQDLELAVVVIVLKCGGIICMVRGLKYLVTLVAHDICLIRKS